MEAEELLEEDANLSKTWVRLDVLLEQVTACHSQVRLRNACWQAKRIFWSVKAAKAVRVLEVAS